MNVHLHIERLVLDGVAVAPGQGARLQVALQSELSRLLAQGGVSPDLQAGGAVPQVNGGTVEIGRTSDSSDTGQQIARAVYRGIGK